MEAISDKKNKFALYIRDSSLDVARQWYEKDNCSSISEFIEKAILYYGGYVSSEKNPNYLPNVIVSTLKSIVNESDNRQNRNLFKVAVELGVLAHMLASIRKIDDVDFEKVRAKSVAEVKKINGTLKMEDVIDWPAL